MPAFDPDATVAALAKFEIFAEAAPADLKKLAAAGQHHTVATGEAIVRQGDFGSSMFFVLGGSLVSRLRRLDGVEIVVSILRKGDTFGELSLAGDRPRPMTLQGNEPSQLFEVKKDDFVKFLGKREKIIARLDRAYRHAAISANLYADALFSDLPADVVRELIDKARMHSYEKDAVIVEQGEEGDAFYLIWSGHVRVVRRDGSGQDRTLAYVAEGDYFGEIALVERSRRTASVIANDHCELITIGRDEFLHLLDNYPDVAQRLRQRIANRAQQQKKVLGSETREVFLKEFDEIGAGFAANALFINLNLCTRCGACSNACHELYGNSRLKRQGKTLILPTTHTPLLMPNSCWHCKDPVCMVCPTDALRRGPTGEIQVIEDRCIGCEQCANRCPWGNITMADPKSEEAPSFLTRFLRKALGKGKTQVAAVGEKTAKAKAVKCDLCIGQEASACVMACPYGAIDRVDPNVFLKQAMEG